MFSQPTKKQQSERVAWRKKTKKQAHQMTGNCSSRGRESGWVFGASPSCQRALGEVHPESIRDVNTQNHSRSHEPCEEGGISGQGTGKTPTSAIRVKLSALLLWGDSANHWRLLLMWPQWQWPSMQGVCVCVGSDTMNDWLTWIYQVKLIQI